MKSIRLLLALALAATPLLHSRAAEPKRVIVVTTTTGFRHSSIPYAEKTLQKLGEESGVYTVVDFARQPDIQVPRKPNKPRDLPPNADDKMKASYANAMKKYDEAMAKWTPEMEAQAKDAQAKLDAGIKESLEKVSPENLIKNKIDMVIFANTTGDLPLPDKDGFIKWIEDGHAFAAMHSGSDTFHHFPGYIDMLGGEFETHHAQVPADLVAADTAHPANAGLGGKWDLKQEEMYHIKSQDRAKVHILWYMQHDPNETATQVFFPVSWCKMAGKGRVFYTSLGHREDLWSDDPNLPNRVNPPEISKQYQAHILGGIKWALGLADGNATPNPDVK
ncbi:MAG TPA: ThuA domain-containing protein [Chthoniobacter sp.]|jgi:type 1 glutamine amidotransferase